MARIQDAAQLLAEKGVHRLVAVDAAGRATGMVSAVDVIRGLLGLPAVHPPSFPHYDRSMGITFCDDTLLEHERLHVAPDGPGVLALISGGRTGRSASSGRNRDDGVIGSPSHRTRRARFSGL